MINVEFRRVNSGIACTPDTWERDWQQTLSHLLKYEFGFGGRVVSVSETELVVQTRVLASVDTMTYTGSAEEMAPLVEAARYWLASLEVDEKNVAQTIGRLSATPGKVGMRAFYVRHLAPLLIGENRLKVIQMMAYGLREKNDVEAGMALSAGDLDAALSLWYAARQEDGAFVQGDGPSGFRSLLVELGACA